MQFIAAIKDRMPDYAKDLQAQPGRGDRALQPAGRGRRRRGARRRVRREVRPPRRRDPHPGQLDAMHQQAALTAAALMGMNNVWYPFVEMADDPDLATLRADLRMNAYANHGGVDRQSFELYALAASIVGKCEFCVRAHYKLLRDTGMTTQQLRDVGRIAAVVNAAAHVVAAEAPVERAHRGLTRCRPGAARRAAPTASLRATRRRAAAH